jgi:signal transduction histidine kinase
MQLPGFTNTLHFRLSALFLVLLTVSGLGYGLWIKTSYLMPDIGADEDTYFSVDSPGELDSLAIQLGELSSNPEALQARLLEYHATVSGYGVDLVLFDGASGRNLTSSNPDSLHSIIPEISTDLVHQMSLSDWDFGSYPNPENVDAYVNQIFEVDVINPAEGGYLAGTTYLVASYVPLPYTLEDLNAQERDLSGPALIIMLAYGALVALIIMAWTSRRISSLSNNMDSFAAGDLTLRVQDRSADEIGDLGRHFNTMAGNMESMVEKLQEKEQFQRQLIANISHDLRTPMASLRGYVETMKVRFEDLSEEDRQKYLSIIVNNLDHLDGLVEHMLILSRFDSGQATFHMEEFPPIELADSVLMRCEGLASERGIKLDLVADDDVPLVKADALQVAQVIQNLLENGIKFNNAGGSVTISIRKNNGRVEVSVADTGMGIAEKDLPHIFDRFYTASQSRTRSTGQDGLAQVQDHLGQSSGLGLAIAAKIIAGHDSRLTVESELGVGTTFTFTLTAGESLAEMSDQG